MASRRNLKKNIGKVSTEIFEECCIISALVPKVDSEKVESLLSKIVAMEREFIIKAGANSKGEKEFAKSYFKKLKSDWSDSVKAIYADLDVVTK